MPSVDVIPLLRPRLDTLPGIVAGFTTRAGGVSEGAYASLNLGLSTDDEQAHVEANRQRLGEAVGIPPERFVIAGQVHGSSVQTVTAPGLYRRTDGLVTATPDLLLCISAADCAAVLLADAEAGIVGACHSGWRGTAAAISRHTIRAMQALGATPERMQVAIGPCISAENFEVGEEVAAQFDERFVERRPGWPRPHVDLKAAIRVQLVAAGVREAHVETSPHCTIAEADRFFSYRAGGGTTGRMMGVIGLRASAT